MKTNKNTSSVVVVSAIVIIICVFVICVFNRKINHLEKKYDDLKTKYTDYKGRVKTISTPAPAPTQKSTPKPTRAPIAPVEPNKQQTSQYKSEYENMILKDAPCVIGDYTVTYTGFSMSHDNNKKSVMITNYKFSTVLHEATAFSDVIDVTLYQDGIELEQTLSVDGYSADSVNIKVKDGEETEVQKAYILRNVTSPVKIEFRPRTELSGVVYKGIIPI